MCAETGALLRVCYISIARRYTYILFDRDALFLPGFPVLKAE